MTHEDEVAAKAIKEGKIDDARKYFSIVLEYSPNDKIALSELSKLEIEE